MIFLRDTVNPGLFIQILCDSTTFELCLKKFWIENIDNEAVGNKSPQASRKKNCFTVNSITRSRIIQNKKIKMLQRGDMFPQVTSKSF